MKMMMIYMIIKHNHNKIYKKHRNTTDIQLIWRDNPDVKVLLKEDLMHIFEYVECKYGKDYIKLYERDGQVAESGLMHQS